MNYLVGQKIKLVKFTEKFVTDEYIGWLNDHEISRYLYTGRIPITKEEIIIPSGDNNLRFAILAKDIDIFGEISGEYHNYVGTISLSKIDWICHNGEIGYMLCKEYWGHGIASEAVSLISDYAFNRLNLHKVEAGVIEGNIGSIKVLEKNGFKEYGRIPDDYYLEGKYHNVIRFYRVNV
jgi:RimJ/RimL family protein N-acetyltransferase